MRPHAVRTLAERGKVPEVIALLEANVEIIPKSARTLAQLAATHETAGHKDKAIELYKAVFATSPNDQQACRRLTALSAPPPA